MDRRKSLKALLAGSVATGVLLDACKSDADNKELPSQKAVASKGEDFDRMKEEEKILQRRNELYVFR